VRLGVVPDNVMSAAAIQDIIFQAQKLAICNPRKSFPTGRTFVLLLLCHCWINFCRIKTSRWLICPVKYGRIFRALRARTSTIGRVKSLDRTVPHPRLCQQFVKGQILSQSVAENRNLKTGEPMIDLRVTWQ